MTNPQFKKIARLLKQVYKELEIEALKNGTDLMSPEYDVMVASAREAVLKKMGFTIEEYRTAKEEASEERKKLVPQYDEIKKRLDEMKIPTSEEIAQIAEEIAKKIVIAPQIINKIVKEIKVERPPQVIKETIHTTERVEYDDLSLRAEMEYAMDGMEKVSKDVESLKNTPNTTEELRKEMGGFNAFAENFEHNVKAYTLKPMQQLAMGLQGQIDTKIEGVNTSKLTVASTAPSSPKLYDLWVDIS